MLHDLCIYLGNLCADKVITFRVLIAHTVSAIVNGTFIVAHMRKKHSVFTLCGNMLALCTSLRRKTMSMEKKL